MKPKRTFKVGDKVKTNYHYRITHHVITAIDADGNHGPSESGVVVLVTPDLDKKASGNDCWIDSNWFVYEYETITAL